VFVCVCVYVYIYKIVRLERDVEANLIEERRKVEKGGGMMNSRSTSDVLVLFWY